MSAKKLQRAIDEANIRGYLESSTSLDSERLAAWETACETRAAPMIVLQKYPDEQAVVMVQVLHTRRLRTLHDVRRCVDRVAEHYPGVAIEWRDDKQLGVIGPLALPRARSFARGLNDTLRREMTGNS